MDVLQILRTSSSISLHDSQDRQCFSIETSVSDENVYYLSVRSVSQCRSDVGPFPDFWHDEIAKVVWGCTTPFIIMRGVRFDIDTFMRSDSLFDNSRVFIGPGNVSYRWKIRPWGVELTTKSNGVLVARWRPHRNRVKSLFSKNRGTMLEISPAYSKDSNMRNAIVITWIIIDGLLWRREQQNNNGTSNPL